VNVITFSSDKEPRQRLAVDRGEPCQLDGIEPPLAALYLGHEGLRPAEVLRNLGLCEPRRLAGHAEPHKHAAILGCVD
jgi:hypothetical protein